MNSRSRRDPALRNPNKRLSVGTMTFDVPRGILRGPSGWRLYVERVGSPTLRVRFADSIHGSVQASLDAAKAYLADANIRPAYKGIDLSRASLRTIVLERRIRPSKGGCAVPRFALAISPSSSELARPWMRIEIGTLNTVTQARIDVALARLTARWNRYRIECASTLSNTPVDRIDYKRLRAASNVPYRLNLFDLYVWNGKGTHVHFSPMHDVDPARPTDANSRVYWPGSWQPAPRINEISERASSRY